MKKLFILVLLVLVGIGLVKPDLKVYADREITKKGTVVAGTNTVVSTQGVTVYKVSGYANSANAVFGLYNASTLSDVPVTNCRLEGGEATQYDGFILLDFGDDGLDFESGLTVVAASGAYISIIYN